MNAERSFPAFLVSLEVFLLCLPLLFCVLCVPRKEEDAMVHIPCNVGGTERTVRMSTGALLLGLGLLAPISKPIRIAAGTVGAIELVTGLAYYCPINQLVGRNTCPTAHRPHD